MSEELTGDGLVSRRTALRLGAAGAAGVAAGAAGGLGGPYLAQRGLLSADGTLAATGTALADTFFYKENFPTSPLILYPFKDALVIPKAMRPATLDDLTYKGAIPAPGPADGNQNGNLPGSDAPKLGNEKHQIWPSDDRVKFGPEPIYYQIKVQVAQHSFTTSQVLPINSLGQPAVSFD